MHPQDFLSVFHGFIFFLLYGSSTAQRRGLGRGGNQVVDFNCPEEFGYYPHPTDCTQYYVCVFGGALLESCTGGLMYSHELQTCDWPRNVGCGAGNGGDAGTISTVKVTDPRTRTPPQQRTSSNPQQSLQAQQHHQSSGRTSQREEALRQRQAQELAQQQQQQQVVYEDELGPAEEVETDRQQRVYRGQPSTVGQVQRDRDGLRPIKNSIHIQNVIPSGPGTAEKVSLVPYNSQRVSQPRQQDQYSIVLTDDDVLEQGLGNLSWTVENSLDMTNDVHSRRKRQTNYRHGGQLSWTSSGGSGQRTRRIPVIIVPDKSQSQSQRNQYIGPGPSYSMYSHPHSHPPRPSAHRAPTSYNSQNNANYHIVHNFEHNSPLEEFEPISQPHVKYSEPEYSPGPSHYNQPSESHVVYEHKYAPPPPPPSPPTVHYPHQVVHLGYESSFTNPFQSQGLFQPANNSRPDLDLVKLTKETYQTAFRPVRPSAGGLEKYLPGKHNFPQSLVPQNFFQSLLETSRSPPEELTLVPSTSTSTTPRSVFLESDTFPPAIAPREPYHVTVPTPSQRPAPSLFAIEPSIEIPLDTTVAGPTRVPLFVPAPVSKRKRKKTTTSAPPTSLALTTSQHVYTEPQTTTLPPKTTTTPKVPKNDHRFYVPPAKTEPTPVTTERPTLPPRRKPIRYKYTSTTPSPSTTTSRKHIPEEYYENFKPFPTQSLPLTSTHGKRQRLRLNPTTDRTKSTTKEDKVTTAAVTRATPYRSSTKNIRVEPAQEYHVTTPSAPVRYNTSARYQQPTQYDQYYQLYDDEADLYRANQYAQQPQQQQQQQPQQQQQQPQPQSPSSTARSPVQQYRGQSAYKQQTVQLEPQRDTYSQDVYAEDAGSQDYNDQDEQQYQQLASPKPTRSEEAQENRRVDTLSEPSIDRPLVTNETIRRSDSFDPAILAPPPRSPPTYLTPPNDQRSYYVDHLPKVQNKEVLLPPKNGGLISKSLNNFDKIISSFFNTVTPDSEKSAPQTILRSEFGRIPHEPIVESKPEQPTVRAPVNFQELPDKDFQTFFVELEPKRPQPNGFFITKPQQASEKPTKSPVSLEITHEELVNPESQEIVYSPQGPVRSSGDGQRSNDNARAPWVPHVQLAVDILPLRAPAVKFNPSVEELEFVNYRKKPQTNSPAPTTSPAPPATTSTRRPSARVTEEAPQLIKNPTPFQFIVVNTETPAPFARNPENEHRAHQQNNFRPEIRSRNPFSESLSEVNAKLPERLRPSTEVYASNENVKEISSSQESDEAPNTRAKLPARLRPSTEVYFRNEPVKEVPFSQERPKIQAKLPERFRPSTEVYISTEQVKEVPLSTNRLRAPEARPTRLPERLRSSGEDINASRERVRLPETRYSSRFAGTSVAPTSSEKPKQYASYEEEDERPVRPESRPSTVVETIPSVSPDTFGRANLYSSNENTENPPRTRTQGQFSGEFVESTKNPASFEQTRQFQSQEEPESRYRNKYVSNSAESTENPISFSREELRPIRVEDSGVILEFDEQSTTTTSEKSAIRFRPTTETGEHEYRKPARKVVKLHRGELKNQRLNGPKVKRIRKPSTQSPEDSDDRSFTRENDVNPTLKPIVVGDSLDADKNQSRFRFTVEDDKEFSIMPKSRAQQYATTTTTEGAFEDEDEKRVVRPAYQPINLDTLDSAEEPIPPRPSTEPPTPKPTTRNPDHDRATAKPSRGRPSLKPRLRTTTASPASQASPHTPVRQRGGSSYNLGVGNDITVNRGTPAPSRGTRPTLKPSTAIVSKASEFIDIYRYPPSRPANLYATPIPDKSAAKCRKDVCLLPDCSCGGKEIPGDYSAEQIPQLVLLTFDDSVNDLNKGLYADLFERGRVNPNGCPISATFYVSHEWTDYAQVQNLYANGHEMASHSVSHSFGEQFSQKKWTREVAGQREILSAYGGVRLEDVRGMRAPFLAVGGNKMFKMLYDANFTYDSSMPVYENKPPSWPYTLDYKLFHDCMIPPCPTKSYPGVWEVPMVMWQDLNGGRCSMGDACSNPPTADGVYKMLIKNFERHFTTNRAPFGLFYHAAWFTHEHHKEGFIAFLDTIVNMPEVWLVTNWQALQWVRDPQPLNTVNNFPAFQCNEEKAKKCNNPKVCNLWHKSGVRYMRTCQPCPEVYPWTGKTGVRNSRVDNEIIDE